MSAGRIEASMEAMVCRDGETQWRSVPDAAFCSWRQDADETVVAFYDVDGVEVHSERLAAGETIRVDGVGEITAGEVL